MAQVMKSAGDKPGLLGEPGEALGDDLGVPTAAVFAREDELGVLVGRTPSELLSDLT